MADQVTSTKVKTEKTYIIQFNQERYMMEVRIFDELNHKDHMIYDMDGEVVSIHNMPRSFQNYANSLIERS